MVLQHQTAPYQLWDLGCFTSTLPVSLTSKERKTTILTAVVGGLHITSMKMGVKGKVDIWSWPITMEIQVSGTIVKLVQRECRRLVYLESARLNTAGPTGSRYIIRASSSLSFDAHGALFFLFPWQRLSSCDQRRAAKGGVLQAHGATRLAGREHLVSHRAGSRAVLFHCHKAQWLSMCVSSLSQDWHPCRCFLHQHHHEHVSNVLCYKGYHGTG